jgi:hypothetical protein
MPQGSLLSITYSAQITLIGHLYFHVGELCNKRNVYVET